MYVYDPLSQLKEDFNLNLVYRTSNSIVISSFFLDLYLIICIQLYRLAKINCLGFSPQVDTT